MRILVVEDHPEIAANLKQKLESECYAVDVEYDGDRGFYRARTNNYDLILLDNVLPGKGGYEICSELREYKMTTPILILSVRKRSIVVTIRNQAGVINLQVQDNGCGISPEVLPKIFDHFFTTKGTSQGIGIGLATIKKIIEEDMKGIITVESKMDEGSLFSVVFPLKYPPDQGIKKQNI